MRGHPRVEAAVYQLILHPIEATEIYIALRWHLVKISSMRCSVVLTWPISTQEMSYGFSMPTLTCPSNTTSCSVASGTALWTNRTMAIGGIKTLLLFGTWFLDCAMCRLVRRQVISSDRWGGRGGPSWLSFRALLREHELTRAISSRENTLCHD